MALSIYLRTKNPAGQWRYARIEEKRGVKTGNLIGPFYTRYSGLTRDGNKGQQWHLLAAEAYAAAKTEAEQLELALEAKAKGLTVAELDSATNVNRIPLRSAINTYLEQKSGKAKKTVAQYQLALNEFSASFGGKLRFLDEINAHALRTYKNGMEKKGYAGKTIDTRLNIVYFLLKKNGITVRLPTDEMPTIEKEVAVPYTDEELQKLFAVMTSEESIRYKFFLGTGCRNQEVSFASWQDIDFTKALYHVRKKEDVGFTVKGHESRSVPIPKTLLNLLKSRREKPQHNRWIFVNDEGNPDNHFLRKLKRIAFKAGLNCGQCKSDITVGKYDNKKLVTVSCKNRPVCEHFYLHRFRKTCATRWHENGIPINTIRAWLGHKNLQTTQIYLGVTDSSALRGQIDKAFGD
jgi:integrase